MLSKLQHPAAAAVLLGGDLLSVASTKLVPRKLSYLAAEFHTLPELIERVKRLLRYVGLHPPLIDFLTKCGGRPPMMAVLDEFRRSPIGDCKVTTVSRWIPATVNSLHL